MKQLTVIISAGVALILAGFLGWLFALYYGLRAIAVCVAMLLALPFSSLMHELGHMLFGAICKIKAVPHFSLFGSSSCQIIPQTDKNLKWRVIFTVRGGLIINFLFFALGLVALFVGGCPVWLALFMPASVYLYILNSLPVSFENGKNDGLVCWEILNNFDESKVMLAVLTVQAQVLNGKPLEEVDETLLFDLPVIREDDQSFIALTELRYEYFKAKGETEQAEKYKARFEELKEYLD